MRCLMNVFNFLTTSFSMIVLEVFLWQSIKSWIVGDLSGFAYPPILSCSLRAYFGLWRRFTHWTSFWWRHWLVTVSWLFRFGCCHRQVSDELRSTSSNTTHRSTPSPPTLYAAAGVDCNFQPSSAASQLSGHCLWDCDCLGRTSDCF